MSLLESTRMCLVGVSSIACILSLGCVTENADDEQSAALESVVGTQREALYVGSSVVWPTTSISVCWEGFYDSRDQQTVRDTVARWGERTNIVFTDWDLCLLAAASASHRNVHITVSDAPLGPHVVVDANGKPGKSIDGISSAVYLDFSFTNYNYVGRGRNCVSAATQAQHDFCVGATALHEFGHVLGFAGEQNRPDDSTFQYDDGNFFGDVTIGPADVQSVMHYGAPIRGTKISFWDTVGVQHFYGMPLAPVGGGITSGTPAVGRNADGRLTVFTLNYLGRLVYSTQTVVNGPFSAWQDFGLSFTPQFAPTVATNADGRLAVFVVDGAGTTYVSHQQYNNGPFGALVSMGGITIGQPAVGRNADGRLEAFVVGTNRQLFHAWQGTTTAFGSWVGMPTDHLFSTMPVIGQNVDGTMDLFGVNWADGIPFHSKQSSINNYFLPFVTMDGVLSKWQPLAIARNSDGRLELFGLGYYDQALYHWTQNGANANAYTFGGRLSWTKTFSYMPTVFSHYNGALEIVGVSAEQGLVHAWQINANQQFTDFFSLSGQPGFSPVALGSPAVGVNQDGRRALFVQSNSGLKQAWQISAGRLADTDGVTPMSGVLWSGK